MERLRRMFRPSKDVTVPLDDNLAVYPPEIFQKTRERSPENYLNTLREIDRGHIEELSDVLLQGMGTIRQGIDVGMIVFGSSIRPVAKRYHDPRDIDIRLISTAQPESTIQEETIESLTNIVNGFTELKADEGVISDFSEWTNHSRVVKVTSWNPETGKEETKVGPYYLDYHNDDPSFKIRFPQEETLPLHISISGVGEDLAFHLDQERKQKQYFSLLNIFSGTKHS